MIERSSDEGDIPGQMENEIKSTLQTIAKHRTQMSDAGRKNLRVALTTKHPHLAQIIRADDCVLVASYLSGLSGTPAPTSQIRGEATHYFSTYKEQGNILWARAQEIDDAGFALILKNEFPPIPGEDKA